MPGDVTDPRSLRHLRAQIALRLKERHLPQRALAQHVGKSNTWISQLLRGRRGLPLELLDRIAHFFDVDPSRLLEDPERIHVPPTWQPDPTRIDVFNNPAPSPEASPNVTTPRTDERTRAVLDHLVSLEFSLGHLTAYRAFIEFIERHMRSVVEEAKAIHTTASLDAAQRAAGRKPSADRRAPRTPRAAVPK